MAFRANKIEAKAAEVVKRFVATLEVSIDLSFTILYLYKSFLRFRLTLNNLGLFNYLVLKQKALLILYNITK